jgi:hypothetical protein
MTDSFDFKDFVVATIRSRNMFDALSRRQGRWLGSFTVVGAVSCFIRACTAQPTWGLGLLGAASLAVGLHLHTRLYLADPEAVAEYRKTIDETTIAVAVRKFTVEQLLRLVPVEYLRGRIERELGAHSLHGLVRVCGIQVVRDFARLGVFMQDELRTMANHDVARATSFSGLWTDFADDTLPHVMRFVEVDVPRLRELLCREFDWVAEDGSLQASRPPGMAKRVLSPFQCAKLFGAWSLTELQIRPEFWRAVLRTSEEGTMHDFSHLVRNCHLAALRERGMVDVAWAQDKFIHEAEAKRWNLWRADDAVDVRKMLQIGLLAPSHVSRLFAEAVPRAIHLASYPAKESDIIEFMLYFEQTFRKFPSLVPRQNAMAMQRAWEKYQQAKSDYEARCVSIHTATEAEIARLLKRQERSRPAPRPNDGPQKPSIQTPAEKAAVKAAEAEGEMHRAAAAEALSAHRRIIHEEFCMDATFGSAAYPKSCTIQ